MAWLNPFRYRGYVYDEETGLYYLRSRYYRAEWGRFLNSEENLHVGNSQPGTISNTYTYALSQPISNSDEDGDFAFLFSTLIAGAAFGAAISAVASAIEQQITTGTIDWNIVVIEAASGAVSGALASTGISLAASVGANAVLGGVTYIAEQTYKGEEIGAFDCAVAVGSGALSGLIGGSGVNAKGKEAIRKAVKQGVSREARRANRRYAAKQTARLLARNKQVIAEYWISGVRYAVGVATAKVSTANSENMLYALAD